MTALDEIDGVGPSYADELADAGYDSAEDVASADPYEVDDVLDTLTGDELVENAANVVEESTDEDVHTLEPDFDETQEYHLLAALVNEEVNARRRSNSDRLEAIQDMLAQVRAGGPYELTMEQLTVGYTASNQLESEYRGTRGLGTFVRGVRDVRDYFKEQRQEHWPDA